MNYWMFRVSNKWGDMSSDCLKNNFICCGWNMDMTRKRDEIIKQYPSASKMAIKFTYINEGDIVIMPISNGIAIGKVISKPIYRVDLPWKDTLNVEWLTKFYPRKNLPSSLQGSLKYRGTFLNLKNYTNEISAIINTGFKDYGAKYAEMQRDMENADVKTIEKHISSRNNLNFSDREFEQFILHLFELNYYGLTGQQGLTGKLNNQKQEAKDGKDLTMSIDYDDFDINIKFNIQVKHHEGNSNIHGINQISKSDDSDPFTKNIVVSTAYFSDDLQKKAKERNIILIGPEQLANIINDNFDRIIPIYQAKLNLFQSINPLKSI